MINLTIEHNLSAEFLLVPNWLYDHDGILNEIIQTVDFETFIVNGKPIKRMIQHYGKPYDYFKMNHQQQDIPEFLNNIMVDINHTFSTKFNSILLNCYPDQNATIAWHSDNEKCLGYNPTIASISLGSERVFSIRNNNTFKQTDILLPNNSLLLMGDRSQIDYVHSVPKHPTKCLPRFNLTFRSIT